MTGPLSTSDLRTRLADLAPGIRSDLEALVRIQSVSADPSRLDQVEASARATADLFAAEGVDVDIDDLSAEVHRLTGGERSLERRCTVSAALLGGVRLEARITRRHRPSRRPGAE